MALRYTAAKCHRRAGGDCQREQDGRHGRHDEAQNGDEARKDAGKERVSNSAAGTQGATARRIISTPP